MRPILDKKTNSIDKHRFHFILDIDVFRAGPYDPPSDDIWDAFDILRNAKNQVFSKSVTEKAKDQFRE